MTSRSMGVLFDMDGVIVLSNHAHMAAWEEFGRDVLGTSITREMFFRSISGRKNEEAIEDLFPGRYSPEELVNIADDKERFYREKYGPHLEAVPGVLQLINDLSSLPASAGLAIAVATSGPPANVEFVLSRFNIASSFNAIINGNAVTKAKPDPAIYLLAASECGVPPSACVVLEDAIAGVQAAKRAGMRCLAVTTSSTAQQLQEAGADAVAPDFSRVTLATLQALL